MNREIKFRMWRERRMQAVHTMYSKMSHNDEPVKEPQNFAFSDDEILMQFTGLHDKNGVEIYEGDILSFKRHKEPNNWASELVHLPEHADVVEFVDGCFRMQNSIKTVKTFISDIVHHNIKAEVIGNIYSNPELIK